MIAVVELLAEVVREPGALVGVELPHRDVDILVVGAVEEQVERGLGVDHPLPAGDRLVVRRRAVHGKGLVGFPQSHLRAEAAGGLGHALDLEADLLPVERDGFHHVGAVLGDELDVGVHAHVEAAAVAGLGEQLLRALGVVGRKLPVAAVAAVERIVIVRIGSLAAAILPQALHDRFFVDGQVEGEPDLASVVQAPSVAGLAGPRARRAVVLAIGRRLARQDHPVLRGVRRLVDAQPGFLRLLEVVTEDLGDVDFPGAQPGQTRRRLRDPADHQLAERGRLAPVARHRLEAVEVALLAVDVAIRPAADRMHRRLLIADRLHVLPGRHVLVADVLCEERRHDPLAAFEVHHDGQLVGRLDPLEVVAEVVGRASQRVGLEALLDGPLDVLGRELAPALVKLHARAELERPGPHLVRGLPFRGQPRAVPEGLRVAHDERIVDAVPQRLLGLNRSPGKRRLGSPLADGDHETIAGGRRAAGGERRRRERHRRGSGSLQERSAIDRGRHEAGW